LIPEVTIRKGGGKQKGSSFERKICRAISMWWSNGEWDDLCWRSVSSGARGTTSHSIVKGYHGDLAPVSPAIEPLFNVFSFEVKFYKEIDISEVLRDCNSKILQWFRQSMRSAIYSKRIPIVIAKSNNYPELLICQSDLVVLNPELQVENLNYISVGGRLHIVNFNDYLEGLDVHTFKEWLKNGAEQWFRVHFPGAGRTDNDGVEKTPD
jgi:hypothetical protein